MTDDPKLTGARPIEERANGPLDAGFAFDAHTAINNILKRGTYKNQDEMEQQIIDEVLAPNRSNIEGYKSDKDDEILIVLYRDSTVLWLQYVEVDGGPGIDIRSGWRRDLKQVH